MCFGGVDETPQYVWAKKVIKILSFKFLKNLEGEARPGSPQGDINGRVLRVFPIRYKGIPLQARDSESWKKTILETKTLNLDEKNVWIWAIIWREKVIC